MILGQWGTLGVFGALAPIGDAGQYYGYVVEISGVVNRNPQSLLSREESKVTIYQHSDNVISVPIVDDVTGEAIPASSFSDAEYVIATNTGKVKARLNLSNGVTVNGEKFEVTIDDGLLDNSFRGRLVHQFVVWNQAGDKLPPVFKNALKVSPVIL